MRVEYDFKNSGLVRADSLAMGDHFVNGGLMSQPNVFMVLERPTRQWVPEPKRSGMSKDDVEAGYVKVFNMTQGHHQRFGADKYVAKVKAKLVVEGYCDPSVSFDKVVEPELESTGYKVKWTIDVNAADAIDAAKHAAEILQGKSGAATVFRVTKPDGENVVVDLSCDSEKGQEK